MIFNVDITTVKSFLDYPNKNFSIQNQSSIQEEPRYCPNLFEILNQEYL